MVGALDMRGGHPAVDFVNTVGWRGDARRRHEYLTDFTDLLAWCRAAGLLSGTEERRLRSLMASDLGEAARMLAGARRLREALHAIWTAEPAAGLGEVEREYRSAMRVRRLSLADNEIYWSEPAVTLRTPIDRITIEAVGLLTSVSLTSIKQCGDPDCGWLFVDHSRRQNRRWCSSAECGNRLRARRHYRRIRTAS
ncbi:CGNR zinc finger domain-containing protein [Mycobacterium sp.]|jgi:predicted RNA-binding Zn ribbon-like protein|uniref:CGNR zinc finger domain-containing protein n=1 Tax=Mycobacterium sp. TaxID=1785 RepID=UPI002D3204F1|nr:CGNR zinc finger domain-containing protein [Mycobacterium sp.]HZA12506.1 CGNR zinc finger domain-containing protein [Mycobacterium sp.]